MEAALEKEKYVINKKAVSEFSRFKVTLPELKARNLGEENLAQYFSEGEISSNFI